MKFKELKDKQRAIRDTFPNSLALRVHRALSWLDKSEQCASSDSGPDLDSQFVFLWIAFNAAYAQDTDCLRSTMSYTETDAFSSFIKKLVELDTDQTLYELMWSQFATSIRVLLDNQYVFQPFWDYHNGKIEEDVWKDRFTNSKRLANQALANKNTEQLITLILQRLYTLRNQIMHGGATWNSTANRSQLRDAVAIMSTLVPYLIDLMMDHPDQLWGDANYPLVI
jgi:hypothetical protein